MKNTKFTDEKITIWAEQILRAQGMSLRHYMPHSKQEIIDTMRMIANEIAARSQGETS